MKMDIQQTNKFLSEAVEQLHEGVKPMDSAIFCEKLKKKTKIGNKFLKCDYHNRLNDSYSNIIVTFINLPAKGPLGGADAMNNRCLLTIKGFDRALNNPPPRGKVKAEALASCNAFSEAGLKFRGRTGTPEKILDYVADFINKLSKVKPRIH